MLSLREAMGLYNLLKSDTRAQTAQAREALDLLVTAGKLLKAEDLDAAEAGMKFAAAGDRFEVLAAFCRGAVSDSLRLAGIEPTDEQEG